MSTKRSDNKKAERVDLEPLVYKWRFGFPLTKKEQRDMWVTVNNLVSSVANRHYKRNQLEHVVKEGVSPDWHYQPSGKFARAQWQAHTDRVLQFYQIVKENPDKNVGWCYTVYARTFALQEQARHISEKGVAVNPKQYRRKDQWELGQVVKLISSTTENVSLHKKILQPRNEFMLAYLTPNQSADWTAHDELDSPEYTPTKEPGYNLSLFIHTTQIVLTLTAEAMVAYGAEALRRTRLSNTMKKKYAK